MSRKLIVSISQLTDKHRAQIHEVTQAHNFTVSFFQEEAEAIPVMADAEVLFSQSGQLGRLAPRLRWQCTPSAGVNQFAAPDTFASAQTVLTNSSGAYGVTIAEHILMVTLELMRQQQEYTQIVARREWRRDLAVRSIRDSRVYLADLGSSNGSFVKVNGERMVGMESFVLLGQQLFRVNLT